jgi:hypothetical protein
MTANATTTASNFTGLYSGSGGTTVPTTPYGNANVVALLAVGSDGGNTVGNISATGNITANYFIGNGSQLTGVVAVSANTANTAVTVTGNAQPNITSVGTLTSLSSTGNVTGGNLRTAGAVSATGNVTGNYILGNGSQLTGLPATYSNANVATFLANFGSNTISTTGNVTAGNLKTNGTISATGNISTNGYFIGTFLGNIVGNLIVPGANTQVLYNNNGNADASAGFTFNSASNVATVAGDVVANNVNTNTVYHNTTGVAIQSNAWAQLQYSNSAAAPVDQTNIGTGSWFYVDPDGGVFQSNTTGTLHTVTLGNDGSVSAQGNITGNYFIGNGSQLTGIAASYGNANVANFLPTYGGTVLANLINFTNNSGIIEQGDQRITITGNAQGVNTGAYFNDTGEADIFANSYVAIATNTTGNINPTWTFDAVGNLSAPGAISAVGNVTANYYFGNGSQLTGLPATYSNANVATFLANFGSNSISTTGNVTASYFVGNGSLLTSITGANVTGTVANATYATTAGSAVTVTANAQPNITSVGTLTSLSTSGNITATGNIQGNVFIGNGAGLTNIPGGNIVGGYGNANVSNFLANGFGSNTISTTGNISAGNITGGLFTGNGSGLSSITGANVTGTVANATYAVTAGSATTAGTVTANAQPNITSVGTLTSVSISGNTTAGNLLTGGIVSATGNVTGNYFVGNGSQLTGIVASSNAAGSNTQIQYNNAGAFAGNASFTFDQSTGNVALANLVVSPGVAGNATAGNNAVIINTATPYNGIPATATGWQAGQTIYGSGNYGNLAVAGVLASTPKGARNLFWDSANVSDGSNVGVRYAGLAVPSTVTLQGNLTSNNNFMRAFVSTMQVGGGASANTYTNASQGTAAMGAAAFATYIGQTVVGPQVGNTTVRDVAALNSQVTVYNGSNVGNAVATTYNFSGSNGNITNALGAVMQFNGTVNTTPTNVVGLYMPTTANSLAGLNSANAMRAATNYYFIKNDDAVAQTQLGSLRSYNEFRYDTATSGSITIDKNNAQVQYIAPTANVTISGYSNMVTSLSDSVNTDQEIDTLTILVQQGATPYTVTLPTGSTYLYAGNVSTVPAVANSQSIITVVASNAAGTVNYFTTVTTDQTTQVPAGGSNTQIQYNNGGVLAGNALMTFNQTVGNVTLSNLVIGTNSANDANLGGLATRINTTSDFNGINGNASAFSAGQMIIGNGWYGNLNLLNIAGSGARAGKLTLWNSANVTEPATGGIRYGSLGIASQVTIANLTNANTVIRGIGSSLTIGGGPGANTFASTTQGISQSTAFQGVINVGNIGGTTPTVGNVTLNGVVGTSGQIFVYAGSTANNAAGLLGYVSNSGNATNTFGVAAQLLGTGVTNPTNAIGFYMGNNVNTYGMAQSNSMRAATNYYFLYNSDAVAQNQLGSLRAYHTFQAGGNTTGTWDIDKTAGQVQSVSATGNITIGSYTNFVTTANDSVNNDSQTDTVTLIIEQGSTPYTVTMPTGNSAIRYANGVSTVTSTANTTTMIAITAYRTSANATSYLTTISPAFS